MNQLERKAAETANQELNMALATLSDIELQVSQVDLVGPSALGSPRMDQLKGRISLCYKQLAKVNDWLNAMSEKAR